MHWIIENKKWLFDGVLVAVPLAIIGWAAARRVVGTTQKQRGGDGSVNLQAGGNIDLGADSSNGKTGSTKRR